MQKMNDFECRKLERYLFGIMFRNNYKFDYHTILKTYKLYCRLDFEGEIRVYNPKKYVVKVLNMPRKQYSRINYPDWVADYGKYPATFHVIDSLFSFLVDATQSTSRYTVDVGRALIVLKALLSLTRKEPRYEF